MSAAADAATIRAYRIVEAMLAEERPRRRPGATAPLTPPRHTATRPPGTGLTPDQLPPPTLTDLAWNDVP